MHDVAERGQIVARLDGLGQTEQAYHHRRDDVHVGDAMFSNERQQVFRREARLQHDVGAGFEGETGVGVGYRMIQRAGDQDGQGSGCVEAVDLARLRRPF